MMAAVAYAHLQMDKKNNTVGQAVSPDMLNTTNNTTSANTANRQSLFVYKLALA